MATVRAVGAHVALARAPEDEDEVLRVHIRLFAELQGGHRVEADGGPLSAAFRLERPDGRAELQHFVREGFRHPGLQRPHRVAFWGGLVQALRREGVETDEETLLALPLETVELDPDLERLFPA